MASSPLRDVRLYRMDLPDLPCPLGLKAIRLLQQQRIPFEDHPLRSQAEVDAFKTAHGVATMPQLFAGAERIGGTRDLAARLGVPPESADVSYTPLLVVFGTGALMALVLASGLAGFMGIALCLLAMLKLMDVPAFATSFRRYDLLSQRWKAWATFYPGVELLLGLGILRRPDLPGVAGAIGALALVIGAMGMLSVGKAVFLDRLPLNCACVGGNVRVPLGVVSFAETLLMVLMGVAMLLQG